MGKSNQSIRVFYSYSHKDEHFREQLEEHLKILQRLGLIDSWHDRRITAGEDWKSEIDRNLLSADIVLLLISPSFISSDYCWEKELRLALERHESGSTCVVPVFVRPVDWHGAPFAGLQGLPRDAVAITEWKNEDAAWVDVAAGLRELVGKLTEQKQRATEPTFTKSIQEALTEDIVRLDRMYNRDDSGEVDGIPTGLDDVDRMMNGLCPGGLFVFASRPGMGKTTLALTIAATAAANDLPVLLFSTKTAAEDVAQRIMVAHAQLDYRSYRKGALADEDWPKLTAAVQQINEWTLSIDDTPALYFDDFRNRCIANKKKSGALPLVILDCVEYLKHGSADGTEHDDLGRQLKVLARELNAAIVVTSNVLRAVESRPNKRPYLGDIPHVRDLADEADVVAFMYLDSYYNSDTSEPQTIEVIFGKNKFGPTGTVRISRNPTFGILENYRGILDLL